MKFYFYPTDEEKFKADALSNFVRTIAFNERSGEVEVSFIRQVNTLWQQTCKNNIETDHRIKELSGEHFQVYSWVVNSKSDFQLPAFSLLESK
ncbi:hypothetical protein HG547_04400 [Shewanella sp. DNRA4]|uniref:hypothetical protein n=1 Tax=Shewanella sp. DNRA4 TaxID=2723055 RepID=UPI00146C69B3|nr:hypothetical protein [Shewanella sp. DNRA4]NMD50872.1 hypothetical protein [Shewanella sp. DNRA4]